MSNFFALSGLTALVILSSFYQLLPFALCECTTNPVIFVFGDSNSDTGGNAVFTGFVFASYPNGREYFHEATGRMCDGRLVIDFLCENVGAKYLTPFLESVGPDFTNGANFAMAGASTLPPNGSFTLGIQLHQFLHFRNRSLHLSNKGYPNLNPMEDFGNALYYMDIGQNDLAYTLTRNLTYDEIASKIDDIIAQISNSIWGIYGVGGRKFWVHNTGPLGCLPMNAKMNACNTAFNEAAKDFNEKLKIECEELGVQMKDATIVYVDVYSIKYDLIANAESYGFKNPLVACLSNGNVCDEPRVSWDGVHYTEAANSFVASRIISSNTSQPFNFFCSS